MSKPTDFLFNSDYEMDQIVWVYEYHFTAVDDLPATSVEIEHGFNFMPLVFGVMATTSDFSDSRPINISNTGSENPATDVRSNSAKIEIDIWHGVNDNAEIVYPDIYVRLYAFEPSNSHSSVGATAGFGSQFVFNTDYNYCKLYKKGVAEGDGNGNIDATITHNLGYIPQIMAWWEAGYNALLVESAYPDADTAGDFSVIEADENSVRFRYKDSLNDDVRVHYRIYYDEA